MTFPFRASPSSFSAPPSSFSLPSPCHTPSFSSSAATPTPTLLSTLASNPNSLFALYFFSPSPLVSRHHAAMGEQLSFRGHLKGHSDWVTSIACPIDNSDSIISCSRDKGIMSWSLSRDAASSTGVQLAGVPKRRLTGHGGFVQDVVISSDGQFALSGSWDSTLRLWDLNTGATTRRFVGHTKDVLSVAFSVDNRQIVSGSRDRSIKLWNTLGECKYTMNDADAHQGWVSCVRFSPVNTQPIIVSAGWDKVVKVWNLTNCKLRQNLLGHTGYVNTVTVSPDGSLCASGGKDGVAMLWDLAEGKRLYSLDAGDIIHSLCFSPNRYWLCAATQSSIKIWDLESKSLVDTLVPDFELVRPGSNTEFKGQTPYCVSLNWSADGATLYGGYTDGYIRVWSVGRTF
ncbi:hypothetical protein CLOM_g8530 [Closterium sp. NIES-68]|nr:hypothetical protein CLOM_g8530 [Closterium sp. NIES-68]